ncbi:MAG: class I SAM-dependent methyltransferase [bacterium]|nr:class I SAM-dependent methyltransferase [bacterium]
MPDERHEQNRRSWNLATRAHNSHKQNQAAFLRDGGSTLFDEERELLGPLGGQSLAHLLCNAGQDSLSLARLGARVTGVDISDEAVEFAKRLGADAGIDATFQRSDVYDWLDAAGEQGLRFDRVFSSYGALPWLSDLDRWFRGAAAILEPDGCMVLVEFHPVGMMLDAQWRPGYPYGTGAEAHPDADGVGDYVAASEDGLAPSGFREGVEDFHNDESCIEFHWSIGQILTAATAAGLTIRRFEEYPHANGCRAWERMRELPGRRYLPPEELPPIPLMFGLVAGRRA